MILCNLFLTFLTSSAYFSNTGYYCNYSRSETFYYVSCHSSIMNRVGKYALFIFIFCCAGQANGVWNKVGQFNEPIASGYFFDRDNGLIGSGNNGNNGGSMSIWWTSNGGTSWNQAKTPTNGNGWISSIFMYDKLTGYASLFSNDYS